MTTTSFGTRELLDAIAAPVVSTDTDRHFATLVRSHFEDLLEREPVYATYLGIHELDDRLGDMSRAAHLDLIAAEKRYLADDVVGIQLTKGRRVILWVHPSLY